MDVKETVSGWMQKKQSKHSASGKAIKNDHSQSSKCGKGDIFVTGWSGGLGELSA